jgi:nickel transport protein
MNLQPFPALPRRAAPLVCRATGFGVAALLLASAGPAHSHAIESSLERLSSLTDQLVLDSRFGNGEPAADAVVRLVPPGGTPIEVGRTDASGQLRFRLPQNATAAWEVQVDQGPGHRDYLELPTAEASPSSLPAQARARARLSSASPGWADAGLAPLLLGLFAAGGLCAAGSLLSWSGLLGWKRAMGRRR